MKINNLNVLERAAAPTPKFFKKLRSIGIVLGAVGATIIAAPVALPVVVVKIATYLTLAGGVLMAVSQTSVDEEAFNSQIKERYQETKTE